MAKNEIKIILSAEDSQFKRTVESAGKELKKMVKDGSMGMLAMGAAFTGIGIAMQKTLNVMDQISKMSSKTGLSVASLSALKYAAELSDVSLEQLELSFVKLSKSIESNSTAFQKINIDLKDSDGRLKSNEQVLMDVADAFAGMEDGAKKTAMATEIFGRAGADMIPLLNGGSEAIKAQMQEAENLGITFDSVSAKQAERFNDAITTISNSANGFTQELVLALMPAIDSLSGKMETASGKSATLKDRLSPLQAIARGIATGFYLVAGGIELIANALVVLWSPLEDITRGLISFGEIFWAILSGDAQKARDLSVIFNAKPFFVNTDEAMKTLSKNISSYGNTVMNTALGTQNYGGSNLPTNAPNITTEEWLANRGKTGTEEADKTPQKIKEAKQNEYTEEEKLKDLYKQKDILAKDELEKAKLNLELKGKLYDLAIKNKATEEETKKIWLEQLQAQQDLIKAQKDATKKRNDELSKQGKGIFGTGKTRQKEYKDRKADGDSSLLGLQQGNQVDSAPDWLKAQVQAEIDYRNAMNDIELSNHLNKEAQKAEIERQYANVRLEIEKQMQEQKLSVISNAFQSVGSFMAKNTLLYKLFATVQATIDTYSAASKALASYPPPFGAIAMGTAIATGLANVATIQGIEIPGYEKGGFAMVGEKGPEIIAPLQDYASGQAALIAATTAIVERKMQGGNGTMNHNIIGTIKGRDLVLSYDRTSKIKKANTW